jgi:redox-sensitive bicupin YhaK (pirin superfamily)
VLLVCSPDGHDGSIATHQDTLLYSTLLDEGQSVSQPIAPGRRVYVHMARGSGLVNGETLLAGDGIAIEKSVVVHLQGLHQAEILMFDLS